MGLGGALFALTAVQAVSQISQGYAQKAENNYNATLLEGKANLIDQQAQIESGQYERLKGRTLSTGIADTAKNGLLPQGSAMAVMLDAQTQINIDQAIGQFNYAQEKNSTVAEANTQRRAGTAAVSSGYTKGFSSLLTGTANYAMYKYKPTNTTFDSSTKLPKNSSEGILG